MEPDEARAIGEWVRSGGRLVAGGAGDSGWLDEVISHVPRWEPDGETEREPLLPVIETSDVEEVRAYEFGAWHELGEHAAGDRPGGRAAGRHGAVGRGQRGAARGRVAAAQPCASTRPTTPCSGSTLTGGARKPVAFLETVHGYGASRGFGGLPDEREVGAARAGADDVGGAVGGRPPLRPDRGRRMNRCRRRASSTSTRSPPRSCAPNRTRRIAREGVARPRRGRGTQGRRRPRRGAGGHARRARAGRSRAAGGRPGGGEDAAGQRDRAGARARVPAAAVHARHAAVGRHRDDGAARRRARLPARARCSRGSSWRTRSTARRPRPRPRCSRRCRRAR